MKDAEIDADRVESMIAEYEKIKNHTIAKSAQIKKKKASVQQDNYVLRDITERLEKSVLPLISLAIRAMTFLAASIASSSVMLGPTRRLAWS